MNAVQKVVEVFVGDLEVQRFQTFPELLFADEGVAIDVEGAEDVDQTTLALRQGGEQLDLQLDVANPLLGRCFLLGDGGEHVEQFFLLQTVAYDVQESQSPSQYPSEAFAVLPA
eukprot:scaffold7182_cov258-Pinguiococcus_pyrenoidosus.AAC.1